MVSAVRLVAFLASISGVLGQYPCPNGYVAKTGEPTCVGVVDASCKDTSCCTLTGTVCSATGWALGATKCKTDSKMKFYDLAKDSAVVTSASDADFRAACCTDCSKATCADWKTNTCGNGKVKKDGTITLASADCSVPTDEAYRAACCVTAPILCSATGSAARSNKCNIQRFYDLAKNSAVTASASDADFQGACCTSCSKATCADWKTNTCGSDKAKKEGAITLASADCTVPTNEVYRAACCVTAPILCSATGWLSGGTKCKTDSKMKFYDLAKNSAVVTSASDADFRAACCTDCSKATCADWTTNSCGNGKVVTDGAITLASADCSVPTNEVYRAACCVTAPILCSATGWALGATKCNKIKTNFYDLAKVSAVATSASDADFRGACCTSCSKATCADWKTNTCGSDKVKKEGAITLASADCTVPTNEAYRAACCVTPPILCSATGLLLGATKCKTDSKMKFYDLAKDSAVVTSASDADFRAACCTDCSKATCADWKLNSCGNGEVIKDGTVTLASADCSVPTNVAYKAACCAPPMACSAYVGDADASTALPTVPPFTCTLLASLAVVVGVHNP